MLNPNIGKLIQSCDNRYRLVIDVAHTAREISAKAANTSGIEFSLRFGLVTHQ